MAKLTPYTVYLPEEHYDQIREFAKKRQASSVVRDAICSFLDGHNQFNAGYNKALKDAARKVKSDTDLKNLSIKNETIANLVSKMILENQK